MKQKNLKIMAEAAVMVSLALVLSIFTTVYSAPLGGSVTLFGMVPIIIIGLRHGVSWGFATAFVFASSYFLLSGVGRLGSWGISPYAFVMSSLFDYIIAYTLLGTAGFFKIFIDKSETKRNKIIFASIAVILACLLRFAAHVIVGAVVWYELTKYIWVADPYDPHLVNSVGMWVYSLIYNAQYMVFETLLTVAAVPAVVTILSALKIKRGAT